MHVLTRNTEHMKLQNWRGDKRVFKPRCNEANVSEVGFYHLRKKRQGAANAARTYSYQPGRAATPGSSCLMAISGLPPRPTSNSLRRFWSSNVSPLAFSMFST